MAFGWKVNMYNIITQQTNIKELALEHKACFVLCMYLTLTYY